MRICTDGRLGKHPAFPGRGAKRTLSGAARNLKVDHATVSRRLAALEAALDVRLVIACHDPAASLSIGRQVFERAVEMEAGVHGIARLAKAAHAPLVGRVMLSAPPVLVTHLLAEQLARFRAEYPDIRLSLSAQARQVSLSRREADDAVRLVRPPREAGSMTRRAGSDDGLRGLRTNPMRIWARRHGGDSSPSIRTSPTCTTTVVAWHSGDDQVLCELNHIDEHLIAVRAGVGVAGLPCFHRGTETATWSGSTRAFRPFAREVWLVVHRDLRKTACGARCDGFCGGFNF